METEVNIEAICRATSYKHYISEEFVMVLSYSAIRKKKYSMQYDIKAESYWNLNL